MDWFRNVKKAAQDIESRRAELKKEILALKPEYESAKGDLKGVVAGQIERLFRDMDRLKDQEAMIRRMRGRTAARASCHGCGLGRGVDPETGLCPRCQALMGPERRLDVGRLEREKYERPEKKPVDIEKRLRELGLLK